MLTGVGTATAVSVSDAAWERWKSVFGDALPREAIRNIAVGTAGLHAVEAGAALISAKRGGVERPGRWAFSTLLWGFPVLRRLRKKKAASMPAAGSVADVRGTATPTSAASKKVSKKASKAEKKSASKQSGKKAAKRAAVAAGTAAAARAAARSSERQAA